MIIVQLLGGLGNQMFQYAFGKSLAHKLKTELILDTRFLENRIPGMTFRKYTLDIFPVKCMLFSDIPKNALPEEFFLIEEQKNMYYDASLFNSIDKDSYLTGYWQSWKYFQHIEGLIREELTFSSAVVSEPIALLAEKMRKTSSISIHIRRTDYLKPENTYIGVLPMSYYQHAIRYIQERVSNPIFYIFSDEPEWAMANFKTTSDTCFIRNNKDTEDLYLMTQCRHNILANSTFSWWGGYLNVHKDKIVIIPEIWLIGRNTSVVESDMALPAWIPIHIY